MASIKDRNEILNRAGYSSYREYLKSELWKKIRQACFLLKGKKCASCRKTATEVHHVSYTEKNLLEVNLKSIELTLFPLCHRCHTKCHFKDGKFRPLRRSADFIKSKTGGKNKASKKLVRARRAMAENVAYQEKMLAKHRW